MNLRKILPVLTVFAICHIQDSLAQKTIVPGKPSLQDRYPKKSGNLLFSDLSVSFPRLFDNQTSTQTLRFYNAGRYEISLFVSNAPAHLAVQVTPSLKPQAEGTLTITYDAAKKGDYGFVMDQLTLRTTDSISGVKTISLATIIEPYVGPLTAEDSLMAPVLMLGDSVFDYQTVKQGEMVRRDIRLTNGGKRDLKILAVKTTCGCIGAKAEKNMLAPGESAVIHASFDSTGKNGRDTHELVLYTNDPRRTKTEIKVQGITVP